MPVPSQNTLNDRVNELEAIVYGGQVIGGSSPAGVVVTAPASGASQTVSGPLVSTGAVQGTNLIGSQQETVVTLTGSTDALPLLGSVFVDSSGVDAMTLATPTAGGPGVGDDGKLLTVTDSGGHAHTITTATNKIVPSHHVITFNGTVGSFVTLQARGGLWFVQGQGGLTSIA